MEKGDARYLPLFGEIPNEVIIKKTLQIGQLEQIALMTIIRGRRTLEQQKFLLHPRLLPSMSSRSPCRFSTRD